MEEIRRGNYTPTGRTELYCGRDWAVLEYLHPTVFLSFHLKVLLIKKNGEDTIRNMPVWEFTLICMSRCGL